MSLFQDPGSYVEIVYYRIRQRCRRGLFARPFFNEHDADFGRCYGIRTSIDHHVVIFCLRTAERVGFDIVVFSGIQQHNTKRLVQGCLSNIAY